jgi:cytochrome d ubiquinol oxidase subunit II
MDLNTLWFVLVAVLFAGFFFLEGFDFGVGMLLPFVGRNDRERRLVIHSIGNVWDGNEVWLLTAGGAMFAAFPGWYATMFSGFYLALVLVLLGLIVRGVGFEFRSKDERPGWRATWDGMIFAGSLVPPLILGVAVGNLLRGVAVDARGVYVGGFPALLNPFALLTGLTFVLLFLLHGASYLRLRFAEGELRERALLAAKRLRWIAVLAAAFFLAAGYRQSGLFAKGAASWALGLAPAVTLVGAAAATGVCAATAFGLTGLTIVLVTAAAFHALYPNVMISTLNPAWSLTVYNASSSPYTLRIMSGVALVMVPVVLAYQGWTYWVFRKRITGTTEVEY